MPLLQKKDGGTAAEQSAASPEELREQMRALVRGDMNAECEKLFEDNIRTLYFEERWPDVFFETLRVYQRAVFAQDKSEGFESRLVAMLRQNGVPFVFAYLLRESDSSMVWNADRFRDLAQARGRRSEFDAALSCIDIALKLEPENSMLYVQRGWLLDDLGRHGDAEEAFRRAIELNASNHSAMNSLAKHLAEKNPKEALEFASGAVELSPGEGTYYDTKGRILSRLGDQDGAIACYDLAIEASPYSADYPYQKGEILLATGREMAAIAQYRKAMSLNDAHIPSLWRLANLYRNTEPELALTYINTIASHSADNKNALLFKAGLLGKLGEEEAASAQFEEIIGEDSGCHEALAGRASLLVLSDPSAAIEYYDKAIALSPKTADYHMGRGRALENMGRINQAVKEYRETVSLDPGNPRAFARLGDLIAEQKPREAAEYYSRAIALMPGNAYYHAAKAEVLLKLKDGAREAIACLTEALRLEPNDARAHVTLAGLLENAGDTTGAILRCKQAIKLDDKNADAFFRLARLSLAAEPDVALLNVNRAINLSPDNGEYYFLKSKILSALGHNRHAAAQLGESLRMDGDSAETLGELAGLTEAESPQLALMYINRAIDTSPKNADYLCARADLLFSMGEREKALGQYNEALKLDSKSASALLGAGRCLAAEGSPKALASFDKAIALSPDMAECYAEKAALLAKTGRIADAIAAYGTAAGKDGENWRYKLELARLLDGEGRTAEACGYYKDVLAVNPECAGAIGRIGILLAESAPDEAAAYLAKAAELFPDEYIYRAWRGRVLLALGENEAAASEYMRAARLGGETGEAYYNIADIIWQKLPETALGFCLKAIASDGGNPGYRLLCGRIYGALGQTENAIGQFRLAAEHDPKCHAAFEEISCILFENRDPRALDAVNVALASDRGCAVCLLRKARILAENADDPDLNGAVACLDRALKLSPDFLPAREKLVEILEIKRDGLRLLLERRKLQKQKSRTET